MGTPQQYNTTMKTILLLCAFAAFVSALPSDDVETDLLTPTTDDIVPEDTLVQETATAGKTVACSSLFNDATEDAVYKGKKYKASPRCYCKPLEARNWNSCRGFRGYWMPQKGTRSRTLQRWTSHACPTLLIQSGAQW